MVKYHMSLRAMDTMWQRRIWLCKITFFQNDLPFTGNRREIIFFGAQKGLRGGKRSSVALLFRKKGEEIFLINKFVRVENRREQTTKSGGCRREKCT